jgi:hypothetical protein
MRQIVTLVDAFQEKNIRSSSRLFIAAPSERVLQRANTGSEGPAASRSDVMTSAGFRCN